MAVLEVQIRWQLNGVAQQNVHYAVGPTLTAGNLQAFNTFIRDAYFTHLRTFLSTTWALQQSQGRVVSVQGSPYVPLSTTVFSGAGNLEVLPLGHTLLVQFTRNSPSPNRKRVYLTGFTVGNLQSGVPAGGIVAAANAWAAALVGLGSIEGQAAQYAVGRYSGSPAYMPTAFGLEQGSASTTYGHMESRER